MNSKIEQLIDEIEDYIDSCKYKPFSADIILVNKAEIEDLLRELRMKTPEEIQKYKKIVSNTEAIINDAKQKAQDLLDNAAVQTNELISEHQIMQQAYSQANEIVEMASQQAQEILDNATIEANNVKAAAMEYTDSILANLENILNQSIEMSTRDYNTLIGNLQQVENVVAANRAELVPPAQEVYEDIENDTENSENVTQE
jgi:uncharacterized membrane-anchored protein YjiN (DUF445 family)